VAALVADVISGETAIPAMALSAAPKATLHLSAFRLNCLLRPVVEDKTPRPVIFRGTCETFGLMFNPYLSLYVLIHALCPRAGVTRGHLECQRLA